MLFSQASQDYIFSLNITQLLAHPDLAILFDNLRNLSKLSLTYGWVSYSKVFDGTAADLLFNFNALYIYSPLTSGLKKNLNFISRLTRRSKMIVKMFDLSYISNNTVFVAI